MRTYILGSTVVSSNVSSTFQHNNPMASRWPRGCSLSPCWLGSYTAPDRDLHADTIYRTKPPPPPGPVHSSSCVVPTQQGYLYPYLSQTAWRVKLSRGKCRGALACVFRGGATAPTILTRVSRREGKRSLSGLGGGGGVNVKQSRWRSPLELMATLYNVYGQNRQPFVTRARRWYLSLVGKQNSRFKGAPIDAGASARCGQTREVSCFLPCGFK